MVAGVRPRRAAVAGAVPWNALAIVVAGGLIGLGLFLGLRPPETPLPRPPGPALVDAAAQQKAAAELKAWLEAQRPTFIRTCWEPSFAKAAEPARISLSFNFTFDEKGQEIGRGMSEHREAHRADVGSCLRGLQERARISPPGATVAIEATISLPN